ncbi:MAG: peptide chain release factor-like protein, partial [Candidatus Omnitrophica bacterium]|nr:peptide chain release factor-like protein [Candidatus Omnitrophota bacterium]
RYRARQILLKKIESAILGKLSEEQKRIEKIRRQKRRRSRRSKLKILESKRRHAAKKLLRVKVQETVD